MVIVSCATKHRKMHRQSSVWSLNFDAAFFTVTWFAVIETSDTLANIGQTVYVKVELAASTQRLKAKSQAEPRIEIFEQEGA